MVVVEGGGGGLAWIRVTKTESSRPENAASGGGPSGIPRDIDSGGNPNPAGRIRRVCSARVNPNPHLRRRRTSIKEVHLHETPEVSLAPPGPSNIGQVGGTSVDKNKEEVEDKKN